MNMKDMFRGRNNVLVLFENGNLEPALRIHEYIRKRPALGEAYVLSKRNKAAGKYLVEKGIFAVVMDRMSYSTDDRSDRIEALLWSQEPRDGTVDYRIEVRDFGDLKKRDIEEIGDELEKDFQQRTWLGDFAKILRKNGKKYSGRMGLTSVKQ